MRRYFCFQKRFPKIYIKHIFVHHKTNRFLSPSETENWQTTYNYYDFYVNKFTLGYCTAYIKYYLLKQICYTIVKLDSIPIQDITITLSFSTLSIYLTSCLFHVNRLKNTENEQYCKSRLFAEIVYEEGIKKKNTVKNADISKKPLYRFYYTFYTFGFSD